MNVIQAAVSTAATTGRPRAVVWFQGTSTESASRPAVQEKRKRLRREVVLPHPVRRVEEPDGNPDGPLVTRRRPEDDKEREEEEKVEEDRCPARERDCAAEARHFRHECAGDEETR